MLGEGWDTHLLQTAICVLSRSECGQRHFHMNAALSLGPNDQAGPCSGVHPAALAGHVKQGSHDRIQTQLLCLAQGRMLAASLSHGCSCFTETQ